MKLEVRTTRATKTIVTARDAKATVAIGGKFHNLEAEAQQLYR